MKAKTLLLTVTLFATLVGLTYAAGPAQRPARRPGRGLTLAPLSEAEIAHITYIREEEKLARDVYLALAEMWDCPVFANISVAEQRHMDAIGRLIARYGLADPITDDSPGAFVDPDLQAMYSQFTGLGAVSLPDALDAGRQIEEQDIADLTVALAETTAADVTRVFENLLRGSDNHLAAFTRAKETGCLPNCCGPERCGPAFRAGRGSGPGNCPRGLRGQGRGGRGRGNGQGQGIRLRRRDASCAATL